MTTNLEGGGVKALAARPLRKSLFWRLPKSIILNQQPPGILKNNISYNYKFTFSRGFKIFSTNFLSLAKEKLDFLLVYIKWSQLCR